jgi:sodium/pantothenate symporter
MVDLLLPLLADTAASPKPGIGTMIALIIFIAASVWLGTLAQKVVSKGSFVKGFFLGNRGLGAWAVALTATVQSGGTFMGFPSLVYSHGWIVALWIGSYMVVPITGFGIVGKRIAQISRQTGAITMPDLFRERFKSPMLGLVTSLLIIIFMTSMMVAQFKSGALVMKLAWPGTSFLKLSDEVETIATSDATSKNGASKEAAKPPPAASGTAYWIGLAVFSLTVVGYTLIGGFLAAVWTDLFQSVMMFIGVLLLLGFSLYAAGGLENANRKAVANAQVAAEKAAAEAKAANAKLPPEKQKAIPEAGPDAGAKYVYGPGFATDGRQYLPLSLAVSFFLFWPATGFASPASVTRIMACKDTATIRRSILLLCLYNLGIYLPLICICMCARALLPALDSSQSDEVIPRMAIEMTKNIPGGTFISGLILAAPFGAIMATVSSYLVVISSGLVRDVYQRFIKPNASERDLKRMAQVGMIAVGVLAVLLNIYPVQYLQALVVFSSGGAGASFIVPCLMLCYWRRATAAGVMAAMLAGAGTMLTLYVAGFMSEDPMIGPTTKLRPLFLGGLEPMMWGLIISATVGIVVTLLTQPPPAEHVSILFDAEPAK